MADPFDPIAVLQALDQHGVSYVVVGALARVLHGSDELTDGIDIVPAMKDENLRRLGGALTDLDARRSNGRALSLDRDLAAPTCSSCRRARVSSRSFRSRPAPPATTTCVAAPRASRSDAESARRSPRPAISSECSPSSIVSRTA